MNSKDPVTRAKIVAAAQKALVEGAPQQINVTMDGRRLAQVYAPYQQVEDEASSEDDRPGA